MTGPLSPMTSSYPTSSEPHFLLPFPVLRDLCPHPPEGVRRSPCGGPRALVPVRQSPCGGPRAVVPVRQWPWRHRPLGSCSLRRPSAVCQVSVELGSFPPRSELMLIGDAACYSHSGLLRRHLELLVQNMLTWAHLFLSIDLGASCMSFCFQAPRAQTRGPVVLLGRPHVPPPPPPRTPLRPPASLTHSPGLPAGSEWGPCAGTALQLQQVGAGLRSGFLKGRVPATAVAVVGSPDPRHHHSSGCSREGLSDENLTAVMPERCCWTLTHVVEVL